MMIKWLRNQGSLFSDKATHMFVIPVLVISQLAPLGIGYDVSPKRIEK
jgi:hypothetical protein